MTLMTPTVPFLYFEYHCLNDIKNAMHGGKNELHVDTRINNLI